MGGDHLRRSHSGHLYSFGSHQHRSVVRSSWWRKMTFRGFWISRQVESLNFRGWQVSWKSLYIAKARCWWHTGKGFFSYFSSVIFWTFLEWLCNLCVIETFEKQTFVPDVEINRTKVGVWSGRHEALCNAVAEMSSVREKKNGRWYWLVGAGNGGSSIIRKCKYVNDVQTGKGLGTDLSKNLLVFSFQNLKMDQATKLGSGRGSVSWKPRGPIGVCFWNDRHSLNNSISYLEVVCLC